MQTFTISQTVSREQISDLLCSAFEGGSNYWYHIVECLAPPERWEFNSDIGFEYDGSRSYYAQDFPLNPGGKVLIVDDFSDDDGVLTLDATALQRGLQVMAEKYPTHFANILSENADAETGDVFLQCCLFGEIVYG